MNGGYLHALHLPVYICDKYIFGNAFLHHSACDMYGKFISKRTSPESFELIRNFTADTAHVVGVINNRHHIVSTMLFVGKAMIQENWIHEICSVIRLLQLKHVTPITIQLIEA